MRDLNSIKIDRHRLKWAIKDAKLTQNELAKRIYMNKDYLNQRIREGLVNEFTLNTLCRQLNVSRTYLTGEDKTTVDDIKRLFPSDSEMDAYYRYTALSRVDDQGYIVYSYEHYEYNAAYENKEKQIKDFLRSLMITVYHRDENNVWHLEEKHTITDEDTLYLMTSSIERSIKEMVREMIVDVDADDNRYFIEIFGNNSFDFGGEQNG